MKRSSVIFAVIIFCGLRIFPAMAAYELDPPVNTKLLVTSCEVYLTEIEEPKSVPALFCNSYFLGWAAAYGIGAWGVLPDGKPLFDICEPKDWDKATFVLTYYRRHPEMVNQDLLRNPAMGILVALRDAYPCPAGQKR